MGTLTEARYLKTFENVKRGYFGRYEYYTNKLIIASIAENFNSYSNIFQVISEFYEMLRILLFGNKTISFRDYKLELLNFENEHKNKNADELSEYIISALSKYIKNKNVNKLYDEK